MAVTGGSGTYSFGATGLPAGFSISASTGIISGSSASSSSNTVLITVTDSNGLQDSKSYNFAVASPPVISPAPLAAAGAGAAYNVTLNVTGGIAAYTWALDSGSLPAGLSLSTAGVISGTPSFGVNVANSPHSFTVRVTDSLGQTDLQAYALTVAIRPAAVEDARRMLRVARVGVAYTDYVPVEGGVGAKAFAATGLPTGLTISATSGFISGTPAGAAGDYPVNITVTDSLGIAASVTKNMRLVNAGMTNIGYSAPIMNPIGLNNSQWSYPTDIDVKDLNADGNLDVVWGALDARGIVVMLGDGQGNFTKYFYANAGAARSRFVKIANMNADGIWDVVTMTADSRIEVYLGNAAGWTNAPVTRSYNVAVDTWGFDIGDMNGDGAEDIVFASWAGNVRALYNCGAAANVNLPAPTACNMANAPLNMYNVAITALSQPRDLVLHNFDGAGGLDIIATSYNTASVQITLGVGNGTYGTPYTAATGATGPRGLVKADMNQDGRMDVVATGDTGISVMLNTAGIAPNNVTLNATSYSIADLGAASEYIDAADINGDGFPDIALAVAGLHQNSVALFMNNGAGDLVNREVWSSVGYQTIGVRFGSVLATSVALSLPDLITTVGSWIGPSRSLVYPNSGNPAKPYNPGLFNFNTNPVSSVNVHGASRVGDLNEDGFNDVIFKVGGAANILLGKADRTFDLSTEAFPTGDISAQWWHGHQLAVADLNGDRHVDLISGNWNGGGLGTVTVLLGVGNGTFGSQYSFSVEQPGCTANLGVRAVDTGDFNRDGKMDILVGVGCTSMNLPRAYVYFGNGDGTFRTATIDRREVSGSNQSVYLVAAVDVN
ncbi:MAG TPA: FG-GAP-like repeat-containing protein, partial [Bdellovibrionales bacterium]|nr:FG-GAP-like repeat-containing protein [Bdellovibrionales bacterium]